MFESSSEEDVDRRLNIEEDIEIREALFEAALEIVRSGDDVTQAQNADHCSSEEDDGVVPALLAESILRCHFKQIEYIDFDSAVRDVIFHLRRAKAASLIAKRKEHAATRRQLFITEVL